MNLWIVNHYAGRPIDRMGGSRHSSLASNLSRFGWKTTILAASTNHRTRVQRSEDTESAQTSDSVTWRLIKSPNYAAHGILRVWNIVVFSLRLLLPRSTNDLATPDVVIGSTVHPFAAWSALRLARRNKAPFVFEVRDLWPETLIDMGAIKRNGLPARLLRALERHLYKNSALIITTMPAAFDYIEQFGIERDHVVWISNGADLEGFSITPPPMNSQFQFLYFGAHGSANDLETILDAFGIATRQNADPMTLRLVGDGPLKPHLIQHAVELGLDGRVFFDPQVPKFQIPELSRTADALVVSLLPLDLYRFGISLNKIYDYLASARPILFGGDPINNPVDEAKAGVCRKKNEASEIAEGMLKLVRSNFEQRAAWGSNGYKHAEQNYSYLRLAEKLNRCLETVVDHAPCR